MSDKPNIEAAREFDVMKYATGRRAEIMKMNVFDSVDLLVETEEKLATLATQLERAEKALARY